MHTLNQQLNRLRPLAPVVLRVVIGVIFLWHGINKFNSGIGAVGEMFTTLGVPLPETSALLSAVIEVVAGAALIVGLGTRVAALALSAVMVVALVFVKADLGLISSAPMPGAELDLSLLAGLVAIVAFGPGPYSVDSTIGVESATTADDLVTV